MSKERLRLKRLVQRWLMCWAAQPRRAPVPDERRGDPWAAFALAGLEAAGQVLAVPMPRRLQINGKGF